jgi:hypothetical protein
MSCYAKLAFKEKGGWKILFLVDDGANIFIVECLSDTPFFHTIDNLNLADHLKGFKPKEV